MEEDEDLALALSLHEEEYFAIENQKSLHTNLGAKREHETSIVDDCWETIDPTPDIRELFLQFNNTYFDGKLSCCEVKWAPRMTLCAGVCCYEGRGGLCSIKLSMPLLRLRPRKDLVQTLLDHNAHGTEFHKHMQRINKLSGSNITVYHNFHDEVDLYRQHWWRCDGPCQNRPPYYGMVRRAMNRPPSPRDPWWFDHQKSCGGSYQKVREPEDYGKKKRKKDDTATKREGSKNTPSIYDWLNRKNKKISKSSTNGQLNFDETSKNRIDKNNHVDLSTNSVEKVNKLSRVENDDNSGRENNKQKINYSFTPFTGQGHFLGSVVGERVTVSKNKHFSQGNSKYFTAATNSATKQENTDEKSQHISQAKYQDFKGLSTSRHRKALVSSTQSKRIDIDIKESDFVGEVDISTDGKTAASYPKNDNLGSLGPMLTPDPKFNKRGNKNQKGDLGNQLTIMDTLKNVGNKKIPVVVINETPTVSASVKSVQCPLCLFVVDENDINTHLDACLS